MTRTFQTHRQVFEELRARACAFGRHQVIGSGFVDPALQPAEINWFRGRMDMIGVDSLTVQGLGKDCGLDLGAWSDGLAGTPARYKSFHFGARDGVVVANLDHIKLGDQDATWVRPIEAGWWLEYIWYP